MGSEQGSKIEQPVHEIYLESFFMDACPVTNQEFKEFIKACPVWQKESGVQRYMNMYYLYTWRKGLIYPKGKRNHPAVYMNWYAAAAYCNWRSREDGFQECYDEDNGFSCHLENNGYRLPTEAEFEKAARGGLENHLYPWGNDIDKSKGNFDNIIGDTTEIASYDPNGYGLYDMGGNIAYWCQDWFDPERYKKDPELSPPIKGTHRVYRGGSWGNAEDYQRVSCRFWMLPVNCNPDFGFRCVRNI